MKYVWPVLLGLVRTAYLAYSLWCRLFGLVLASLLMGLVVAAQTGYADQHPALWQAAGLALATYLLLALYAVIHVYRQRSADDPNPGQSAFMAWFGTLKVFRNDGGAAAVKLHWPSHFLVENPRGYRISGASMRAVLDLLQDGDILLRGYEGYVDGEFIRRSSVTSQHGFQPGWFTHAALYVGTLGEKDRQQVPAAFRNNPSMFAPGPQRVIHSMANGVHTEDILTFLRCDYLAVLRIRPDLTLPPAAPADGQPHLKQASPPSLSDAMMAAMQGALAAGGTLQSEQVVAAARQSALEKIGEDYDFDCSDTKEFNRFSCAELVYYCLRGALGALQLKPLAHALYPLVPFNKHWRILERVTITPDDFHELVAAGSLDCIWEDGTSRTRMTPTLPT
jgi:hypothetical protein